MTDARKDLDYYTRHPEELPDDPSEIEALLGGQTEETPAAAPDEQSETRGNDAATGEDTETTTDEALPIQTKDGQRTIPYNVLDTERKRRQAAEQIQRELQQKIADLEARAPGQVASTQQETTTDLMADEELEALVADFPAIAKLISYTKAMETKVGQFEDRFKDVESKEMAREQEVADRARQEVRAVVDGNGTLLFWEQNDPEKWQAAIEADSRLSQLSVNQGLSLEERFVKAVTIVETIYGPTELPEEFRPKVSKANTPGSESTIANRAKEVIEKAGVTRPRTLSEMSGGAVPSTDPLDDLMSLSAERIGNQMAGMTPTQIEALLARVG